MILKKHYLYINIGEVIYLVEQALLGSYELNLSLLIMSDLSKETFNIASLSCSYHIIPKNNLWRR